MVTIITTVVKQKGSGHVVCVGMFGVRVLRVVVIYYYNYCFTAEHALRVLARRHPSPRRA